MIAEDIVLHKKTRIVSVVAATTIALACGTNYAYGAWAPQFADKLQLSATESNVVGTAANLGMYAAGIPVGFIADRKSPRLSTLIGAVALLAGYYPIKLAYDGGPGYMSLTTISFCSFLSGVGSCAASQGALKTATLNWPTHRGTATAFPLAAFGLSAFFYTLIAGVAFPGDTSGLLLMFSLATSLLVLVSIPFLIVVDRQNTSYAALPTTERPRRDSNLLHRTKSSGGKHSARALPAQEISTSCISSSPQHSLVSCQLSPADDDERDRVSDECSSLISGPGDVDLDDATNKKSAHSRCLDVTGLALLYKPEFWQLWVLMALLTGVGLMTINNIGHNVQALWNHWDKTVSQDFVAHRQLWHVSILSVCSFFGRLFSGIGSDIIVKRLGHSRFWCAAISATVFAFAQLCAIRIEDPNFLWAVSGLSGFAYGALFGVLPALVVDAFGSDGFSVNWGCMTLAPVISGNVFNLFYGAAFDSNSVVGADGNRICEAGLECYRTAYYVTLVSSVLGILACFWGIYGEHSRKRRELDEFERHRDA